MDLKKCTKCHEIKSVVEFHKNKTRKDGYESWCKECKREYKKQYRNSKRGKEIERLYKNNYRKKEVEYEKNRRLSLERRKYLKSYRENNKKRIGKLRSKWGKANLDRISIYNQVRIAKKKKLRYEWGKKEYDFIMNIFGNGCALTGDKENIELDHFIALSTEFGGTYIGNMLPLKAELNNSKKDKNPFEWIREQPEEIKRNFDIAVEILANQNSVEVHEFRLYVNSCYESSKKATL